MTVVQGLPIKPLVTVAVPSYNQGRFLGEALESLLAQDVALEVYVLDGGSTDETRDVIARYEGRLAGWRSARDAGQAAAINEGVARGSAPYVCWLNSDDALLPGALARLVAALEADAAAPMAYGRVWNQSESGERRRNLEVRPFNEWLMARMNLVSQPATLIRRDAWNAVGGVDPSMRMAMDYDLWWKLYRHSGSPPRFVDDVLAVNRVHPATKTNTLRRDHYREAMSVVRKHYGRVPWKWWLAWPYAVWWRSRGPM